MRLIAGDRAARGGQDLSLDVETAYRERRVRLFNYFLRCGISRPGAEDLTQGVFLVLLEQRDRYNPARGNLDVYMFGIARNLRRAWARRNQWELPADPVEISDRKVRTSPDLVALKDAVQRLGEDYRETLILREFQGFSYDEIATIQDVPKGTVRSRLARARAHLRDLLRPGPGSD